MKRKNSQNHKLTFNLKIVCTDNDDKTKMLDFFNADWDKKIHISNQFRDQRYKYFAHRLIYEESPQTLPSSDYQEIHKIIAKQVLSTDNEKWNTIPKAYQQLDNLRVKLEEEQDDEKLLFLDQLNDFLFELQNKYEKA
jgi:exodeoxyribonuclease-1